MVNILVQVTDKEITWFVMTVSYDTKILNV